MVKTSETGIVEQDMEKDAFQKVCGEAEYKMDSSIAKLLKANRQLKQESEERAQTEQALKKSQQLLQTLIDTIEWEVFAKDSNGKYLFVNNAFGKDFDVDPNEIIGKDDFFVFAPETAEILQKNDQQIMAAQKAVNIEESTILRGKHVTYLTNKVPLIDDDGNVFGICGVGFDITRQKKLEKALKEAHINLESKVRERTAQLSETVDKLREAELRYRTVADFTYDWEYWTSMDGTSQYVSPSCERISGYTPQQFMDTPSLYRDIIIPEDQDIWKQHFHDIRKELKTSEMQFRIRCRDGSVRWIEHTCQPVRGDQKELSGFRGSNHDITKRKEGEIKLRNAYSEIKELKTQLEADRTYLREEIKLEHDYENIIGNSDMIKYVLNRAEQIAALK